jgi:hypothetical protein
LSSKQRVGFLNSLIAVLTNTHDLHHPVLSTRLAKSALKNASILLGPRSDISSGDSNTNSTGRSKKGKKRAREYEGDEVFKLTHGEICATNADGNALLLSIDGVSFVLVEVSAVLFNY